jgi:hypothetical protein
LKARGALSFEAPLVAVDDLVAAVVVVAAVCDVAVEVAPVELIAPVDEASTVSVFVEVAPVLTELTSFPPSPHETTVSQPPANVSSQYDDWFPRAK